MEMVLKFLKKGSLKQFLQLSLIPYNLKCLHLKLTMDLFLQ